MKTYYPSAVKSSSSIRTTVSNKKTNQSASFFHHICFSATILGTRCFEGSINIILRTNKHLWLKHFGRSAFRNRSFHKPFVHLYG